MKNILLAVLLLVPALAWAQKPAPSPAAYTITVHVQSSRLEFPSHVQRLTVVIEGKKYELQGTGATFDVFRPGDYKAKIARDDSKQAYEYRRTYEFQLVDGTARKYDVVGEAE
jgi:hypothetical protein